MNISQIKFNTADNVLFKKKPNKINKNEEKRSSSLSFGNSIEANYRSMEIKNSYQENMAKLATFSKQKGKVTKEQYEEIRQNTPELLPIAKQLISRSHALESTPETIAQTGIKIKNILDKEYGDYTIVSVGTSASGLSEVIENLGVDVIYLPISGLRSLYDKVGEDANIDEIEKEFPNVKICLEYLQKELSKKPEKPIILLDYSATGKTLKNLSKLIEDRGIASTERVRIFSIIDELTNELFIESENFAQEFQNVRQLNFDFGEEAIASISNVPHFYIQDEKNNDRNTCISSENKAEDEIYKEFESFSQPFARLFLLCAIDEAQKLKQA